MYRLFACACAGCAATVPMTFWMLAAWRLLPPGERYALPPEQITGQAAQAVGLSGVARDKATRQLASLAGHFAYGAAAGALYAPLRALPGPALVKGLGFGTLVWAGSYFRLLPALGLLSSARHHPAHRNALMLVAHLIWGGATALLSERLGSAGAPSPARSSR